MAQTFVDDFSAGETAGIIPGASGGGVRFYNAQPYYNAEELIGWVELAD